MDIHVEYAFTEQEALRAAVTRDSWPRPVLQWLGMLVGGVLIVTLAAPASWPVALV